MAASPGCSIRWKNPGIRCLEEAAYFKLETFVAHEEALHRGWQCFSVARSLSGLNDKDLKCFSMMALYFFQLQGGIYPTALHCHNLSLHQKDCVNRIGQQRHEMKKKIEQQKPTASLATNFTHLYTVSHCFTS